MTRLRAACRVRHVLLFASRISTLLNVSCTAIYGRGRRASFSIYFSIPLPPVVQTTGVQWACLVGPSPNAFSPPQQPSLALHGLGSRGRTLFTNGVSLSICLCLYLSLSLFRTWPPSLMMLLSVTVTHLR